MSPFSNLTNLFAAQSAPSRMSPHPKPANYAANTSALPCNRPASTAYPSPSTPTCSPRPSHKTSSTPTPHWRRRHRTGPHPARAATRVSAYSPATTLPELLLPGQTPPPADAPPRHRKPPDQHPVAPPPRRLAAAIATTNTAAGRYQRALMNLISTGRRVLACGSTLLLTTTGCAFQGVNTLPLPGAVGRGPGAAIYHLQMANVGTLEPNSPVLISDVVVGSVGAMKVRNWHADIEVSVKPDVAVPANAVATVGQTSLLGSMHLALDPPPGQAPTGRLTPGATIALNRTGAYPSTEQTLSALSLFINSGGVAQIGDIIRNVDDALHGREGQIRDALTRLDTFLGAIDRQRDNITATIDGLDRLTATLAAQNDTIAHALHDIPPALDVLIRERPA